MVAIIIQARMGSSRLKGKVLMPLGEKTVIEHVIERLKNVHLSDKIIVATTTNPNEKPLIENVSKLGINIFQGSESNVLDRYYKAAKKFNVDIIVRITSDCPCIDPTIVDQIIEIREKKEADYASNTIERTFPRGLDVEVFTFETLEKAWLEASKKYQQEHVTPYIYENPNLFKIESITSNNNLSKLRLTLDTFDDYLLIKEIYSSLYNKDKPFLLKDIENLFKKNPAIFTINQNIKQKDLKDV